ncbi:MD-2-related lipid-recognition protein-like [Cydia strobilella]|uniref:MD-2-related lipid-recognition protein-like n=1 Tax=Cydia strobilella TaxID=1100964 RepID=UPI003004B8DC
MWARAVCVLVCVTAVTCEAVTKKFCDDVNPAVCTVHSVDVDPCPKGINFCSLYRNKPYTLSVDFTPRFSAQNLRLAMYGDDNNDGSFDKTVKTVADPCDLMTCPVDKNIPRFFNLHFTLDKTHGTAKFPVKFKLWNGDNESQACCFTFNVKVKK